MTALYENFNPFHVKYLSPMENKHCGQVSRHSHLHGQISRPCFSSAQFIKGLRGLCLQGLFEVTIARITLDILKALHTNSERDTLS